MNDDDLRRVREALERSTTKAAEWFESLTPDQKASLDARAQDIQQGACPTVGPEAIGQTYEEAGWLSKADYLEMTRVIHGFLAGRPVADDDLDAMLALLGGSKESIVRTRVLTLLGEMVRRDGVSAARRTRIEEAIAPFRTGPDDLDVLSWAHVRKALDATAG